MLLPSPASSGPRTGTVGQALPRGRERRRLLLICFDSLLLQTRGSCSVSDVAKEVKNST